MVIVIVERVSKVAWTFRSDLSEHVLTITDTRHVPGFASGPWSVAIKSV
jgi:hypothetical protein